MSSAISLLTFRSIFILRHSAHKWIGPSVEFPMSFEFMMKPSSSSYWWYFPALISSLLAFGIAKLFLDLYWKPWRLHRTFKQQGISGPEPQFFYGNVLQIRGVKPTPHTVDRVYPFYRQWSKAYGDIFLFWFGSKPSLMVGDPELIREVLCDMSKNYDREPAKPVAEEMFGQGVAMIKMNEKWSQQRKMLGPAFSIHKLQSMITKMTSCVEHKLKSWSHAQVIDAALELRSITADVICRTAFGTDYEYGKRVFDMQLEQQAIIHEWESSLRYPGASFFPSAKKRYRAQLKNKIEDIINDMVLRRLQEGDGDDMLGVLLSARSHGGITLQNIVDECKTFFFTGQETSAALLSWTVMLLASNEEQQQLLREEVLEILDYSPPKTLEQLSNLKKMEMAFQEALRLFPPIPRLRRYAWKNMKLRDIFIPKGTVLHLPLIVSNYSEKIWGSDVEAFRPQRFQEVDKRYHMPFSIGPRACIGQNFAMVEVKIILAMILQKFQFKLHESYIHEPLLQMTLRPKHGVPVELNKFA